MVLAGVLSFFFWCGVFWFWFFGVFSFFGWSGKAEASFQKFLLSEIAIVEAYQVGPEKMSTFLQSEEKL